MLIGPTFLVRLSVLISKHIQLHNIVLVYLQRIGGLYRGNFTQNMRENAFRRTPTAFVLNYGNSLPQLFLNCLFVLLVWVRFLVSASPGRTSKSREIRKLTWTERGKTSQDWGQDRNIFLEFWFELDLSERNSGVGMLVLFGIFIK